MRKVRYLWENKDYPCSLSNSKWLNLSLFNVFFFIFRRLPYLIKWMVYSQVAQK